jgi:hypothetical protein
MSHHEPTITQNEEPVTPLSYRTLLPSSSRFMTAHTKDIRNCMTKMSTTILLTSFYSLERLSLNLTELRANFVSRPVYTHTPTVHNTFFNVLPFRIRLLTGSGTFSSAIMMLPLNVCMNGFGF